MNEKKRKSKTTQSAQTLIGWFKWGAGAVRRSCTNPLNARLHGSHQPNNTGHDDHTSRGDTVPSSRGWLHDAGGTQWRNTRSEAAPLKPSVLVNEAGCRTLVKKAGYNWLCRLVTTTVTPADYRDWLRWWLETHGGETIEIETKTGRYELTRGRDDRRIIDEAEWRSYNKVRVQQLNGWIYRKLGPTSKIYRLSSRSRCR